ncbi:cysteate racemase [Acinetobacter larvae]|uniref:Aspartate racemase n=1 Tax=Acinetobacter larvae TaxID=1789224 RepID=A0A1B2LXI6_9GAMM|nr:amino acid racemase [Acinetobacter larvae]AOA57651.1 aspartate racemase [Acinetobacter larvae]
MRDYFDYPILGVLGGMGPAATVDFQQRLLNIRAAEKDQDHLAVVTWNHAGVPDRQLAIQGLGASPVAALQHGIQQLIQAGADKIAMPCNTVHYWHATLQQQSTVDIFNMIDLTVQQVKQQHGTSQKVAVLATCGALQTGLYQHALQQQGIDFICNDAAEIEDILMPAVYAVKANQLQQAGEQLHDLGQRLLARGADSIILACTELPIALAAVESSILAQCFDTTQILAEACVAWSDDYYNC